MTIWFDVISFSSTPEGVSSILLQVFYYLLLKLFSSKLKLSTCPGFTALHSSTQFHLWWGAKDIRRGTNTIFENISFLFSFRPRIRWLKISSEVFQIIFIQTKMFQRLTQKGSQYHIFLVLRSTTIWPFWNLWNYFTFRIFRLNSSLNQM